MAIMTAIELVWWVISWMTGRASAPFLATHILLALAGLAAAVALRLAWRRSLPRAVWPSVLSGTLLVGISASLFLPLKYAIPKTVPFWLDMPIADAERRLFGGDPWQRLEQVMGWATGPLDRLYGLWLPVQILVLFTLMLAAPSRAKSHALIAYSLAWVLLGIGAATIFSSAGPIFYDRLFGADAFAALPQALQARGAWVVLAESDEMWRSFATGRAGLVAGMSAVPSMHVAISFWIVLAARAMSSRLTPLAVLYAIVISIGSVQLGWHYVSDGLVGLLGMAAIWSLAGALQRHLEQRDRPSG